MENQSRTAERVTCVSIAVNAALSLGKLAAGLLARSGAMVSDAIHSASDVFSSIIVLIGVRMSGKAADREHPFGHERLECVVAVMLAMILLATGLWIGYGGVKEILYSREGQLAAPGALALVAAAVSIAVKECLYRYTCRHARRIRSDALMADAWHHRSDALSSVGAFIGIAGARIGLPVMDPIASLVICVFIAKAAYEIFRDAVDKLVDHSCDADTEAAIRECVLKNPAVRRIDLLRTREFGSRAYIELEIALDASLPLESAHDIAEQVHDAVEAGFPMVKHIMIHVNPDEA